MHQPLQENPAPLLLGVGAILQTAVQPELVVCFICAVLGAGIGLAFLPAPKPAKSRRDLAFRFVGNALFIMATAIVAMFGMAYLPSQILAAQYPAAFFLSMLLMLYRDMLIVKLGGLFGRKLDGV